MTEPRLALTGRAQTGRDVYRGTREAINNLRARGIGAVSSAAFSTDGNPPDAIRVCLGGPSERDEVEESLRIINDTIDDPHHLHSALL